MEEGRSDTLGAGYPRELSGVASNLNALLVGERKRVARYRDTLGNLAHSLKTPLAVMRSSLPPAQHPRRLSTEIDRMSGIIEHQLKRAAASGGALLGQAPVDVAQVAAELRGTLLRVYAGKDLSIELGVAANAQFIGDRGDLTELLGNLLDNACKWCRSRVLLRRRRRTTAPARASGCRSWWRTTVRASRRRIGRGCSSAACAPTRTCRVMVSGSPWCATRSTCTADA